MKIDMNEEDSIVWCYRLFLGREPESQSILLSYKGYQSIDSLREGFIRSKEFEFIYAKIKNRTPTLHPELLSLDLAKNYIDTEASKEQLVECVAKIKQAWTHLGIEKPHFSVLTNDKFLPVNLNDNIKSFWASGEEEVVGLLAMLAPFGFSNLSDKICVEYGCGVGRITMSLMERFAHVYAYDISEEHLACAKTRYSEFTTTNVSLLQCSETFLENIEKCDFFYSRIVFQHNPPPVIVMLIKIALQSLNPGGIAVFQVPTWNDGYNFNLKEWLAFNHSLEMQMHCLPQEKIFSIILNEGCTLLSVREDSSTGPSRSFLSNTFIVRKNIKKAKKFSTRLLEGGARLKKKLF